VTRSWCVKDTCKDSTDSNIFFLTAVEIMHLVALVYSPVCACLNLHVYSISLTVTKLTVFRAHIF
jgi:hypothetical protein